MSKKIISAILAIAMIVSMSATMFVTSVGAAADTDYTADRDALLEAIRDLYIKGPNLSEETVTYLKDLGIIETKDGKDVQTEARKTLWKDTAAIDLTLDANKGDDALNGYFFTTKEVKDADGKVIDFDAKFITDAKLDKVTAIDVTGKSASEALEIAIQYAASVWYYGQDADNEVFEASFNEGRNELVKAATEIIANINGAFKKQVTADAQPTGYAEDLETYKSFQEKNASFNSLIGVNPYYQVLSDVSFWNTYKSLLANDLNLANWITFEEMQKVAPTELAAFKTELNKMAVFSAKEVLYLDFAAQKKALDDAYAALIKALKPDVKEIVNKLDYDKQINAFVKLRAVLDVFNKYQNILFNNVYTTANADLVANALYAKEIEKFIGTGDAIDASKLYALALIDVDALTNNIINGMANMNPTTLGASLTLTAEDIAAAEKAIKSAELLLENWSAWETNDDYKATFNALKDAKNNLKGMIPVAAGENVYYQVAEGVAKEKFNDVEYKNAAFTMYFVPNYLAYTQYLKALEKATEDFVKKTNPESKLDAINLRSSKKDNLEADLLKYDYLAGYVLEKKDITPDDEKDNKVVVVNEDATEIYQIYFTAIYEAITGEDVSDNNIEFDIALDNVFDFINQFKISYLVYTDLKYDIDGKEADKNSAIYKAAEAFKDSYTSDWKKDDGKFSSKYDNAAAKLEEKLKNFSKDIATQLLTYDFILKEVAKHFGLKDTENTQDHGSDPYVYYDITNQYLKVLLEELGAYIQAELDDVKPNEYKANLLDTYIIQQAELTEGEKITPTDLQKLLGKYSLESETYEYVTENQIKDLEDAIIAKIDELNLNDLVLTFNEKLEGVFKYINNLFGLVDEFTVSKFEKAFATKPNGELTDAAKIEEAKYAHIFGEAFKKFESIVEEEEATEVELSVGDLLGIYVRNVFSKFVEDNTEKDSKGNFVGSFDSDIINENKTIQKTYKIVPEKTSSTNILKARAVGDTVTFDNDWNISIGDKAADFENGSIFLIKSVDKELKFTTGTDYTLKETDLDKFEFVSAKLNDDGSWYIGLDEEPKAGTYAWVTSSTDEAEGSLNIVEVTTASDLTTVVAGLPSGTNLLTTSTDWSDGFDGYDDGSNFAIKFDDFDDSDLHGIRGMIDKYANYLAIWPIEEVLDPEVLAELNLGWPIEEFIDLINSFADVEYDWTVDGKKIQYFERRITDKNKTLNDKERELYNYTDVTEEYAAELSAKWLDLYYDILDKALVDAQIVEEKDGKLYFKQDVGKVKAGTGYPGFEKLTKDALEDKLKADGYVEVYGIISIINGKTETDIDVDEIAEDFRLAARKLTYNSQATEYNNNGQPRTPIANILELKVQLEEFGIEDGIGLGIYDAGYVALVERISALSDKKDTEEKELKALGLDKIFELEDDEFGYEFLIGIKTIIEDIGNGKVYDSDNRLWAYETVRSTKEQYNFKALDPDDAEIAYQNSNNYPKDVFSAFVSAANGLRSLINSNFTNDKGENAYKRASATSLKEAYEKFIKATKELLTDEGEAGLDRFIDKVYALAAADLGKKDKEKDLDFAKIELEEKLYQTGINLGQYLPVRADFYYWYAYRFNVVLNNDQRGNLYSYVTGSYKSNYLDKLQKLIGEIKDTDYTREWAESFNAIRKQAAYINELFVGATEKDGKIDLGTDMPLWYALKVLNAVQAAYDEKDNNKVADVKALKAETLELTIAAADALDAIYYTTEDSAIWDNFVAAYAKAIEILLDARCTKDDVNNANDALVAAMEELAKIEKPEGTVTVDSLKAKVADAEALLARADVTTDASKAALKEVIALEKQYLQFIPAVVTVDEIKAEITKLDNAMKALNNAMYNAAKLKKATKVLEMQVVISKYTDVSYNKFKRACDNAYELAAADTAKESEFLAAYANVETHYAGLKEAPVEEPVEEPKEEPVEEPKESEVLKQAIAIYNEIATEYGTLTGYTAESKAALKAALDTLKAAINDKAEDAKLLESIIAVKLARAALVVPVPETFDEE